MKLQRFGAALALAALPGLGSVQATMTSCASLGNTSNPFLTSMALIANISTDELDQLPIESMAEQLEAGFPSLATCVANINVYNAALDLFSADGLLTCMQSISSLSLSGNFSEAMILDELCPTYVDTIVPCVVNQLLPVAMELMGPCCSDLKAEIVTTFGKDLTAMVDELLHLAGDMLCSVKTYKSNGVAVKESCGFQLLSLFVDNPDILGPLLTIFQIPNNQVCKAVSNQVFVTTMGNSLSFGDSDNGYGICYETMDSLFSAIAAYPWFATANFTSPDSDAVVPLSNLFTNGTCVSGSDLLSWAISNDSVVMHVLDAIDVLVAVLNTGSNDTSNSTNSSDGSGSGSSSWLGSVGSAFAGSSSWTGSVGSSDVGFSAGGDQNISVVIVDAVTSLSSLFSSLCLRMPNHVTCPFTDQSLVLAFDESSTPSPTSTTVTPTATTKTPVTPTPTTKTPTTTKKSAADMTTYNLYIAVLSAFIVVAMN